MCYRLSGYIPIYYGYCIHYPMLGTAERLYLISINYLLLNQKFNYIHVDAFFKHLLHIISVCVIMHLYEYVV